MKNKQGFSTLVLIIILAVLAGGGYYVWKNQTNLPAPPAPSNSDNSFTTAPTPPTDLDTSNWKTYRDDQYGFSISYPKSWSVDKITEKESGIHIIAPSGKTSFSVIPVVPDGLNSFPGGGILQTENIKLLGHTVVKTTRKNLGDPDRPNYITYQFITYQNNGWTKNNYIALYSITNSDTVLLESIFSTFRFTK
ncbi:MAG: hypothetical protein HY481_01420 [Candidatus Vogelbacteria bacterium]|nr:hypothetical protein [Candidatus Vogelbacteria bacterium]